MPRPTYLPEGTLTGTGVELQNVSLLDFWKWAFSDLCDDDLKGIFAEWIVLKLLGIPSVRRMNWANSDIMTTDGVRIEIKSTSYWQSWKLMDEMGVLRPTPLYPISSKTRIGFRDEGARINERTVECWRALQPAMEAKEIYDEHYAQLMKDKGIST